MKNLFRYLVLAVLAVGFVSCESDDEKFSGSPVGHQNIVTLKGSITTDVTAALAGQKVKFIAHLPEGKSFADTVRVEVSAINKSYGRIREYLIFEPGVTSMEGEILSPGGAIFDTSFELSMTAIELYTVEQGTHYLMTSDPIEILTGNSSIPATVSDRLLIRLTWFNGGSSNNVRFFVDKPGTLTDYNINFSGNVKNHAILTGNSGNQNAGQSWAEGEYVFSITGISQTEPLDLVYRLILVYPNGDSEVIQGVYEGMTNASPLKPILKVTKVGFGDDADFNAEPL